MSFPVICNFLLPLWLLHFISRHQALQHAKTIKYYHYFIDILLFFKTYRFFSRNVPLHILWDIYSSILLITVFVNTGINKCTHLHVCVSAQKQSLHVYKMGDVYKDIGTNAILPKSTWDTSELNKLGLLIVPAKENKCHGELYIPPWECVIRGLRLR